MFFFFKAGNDYPLPFTNKNTKQSQNIIPLKGDAFRDTFVKWGGRIIRI